MFVDLDYAWLLHPAEKRQNDFAKISKAMGNVFATRSYLNKQKRRTTTRQENTSSGVWKPRISSPTSEQCLHRTIFKWNRVIFQTSFYEKLFWSDFSNKYLNLFHCTVLISLNPLVKDMPSRRSRSTIWRHSKRTDAATLLGYRKDSLCSRSVILLI